ncbi:energy transducer TonB [Dyadobacter sp. CY343]|uniref:energy transducer TonB n=1 Tax=Dyadobacter sp. CY343 TaxID=2907299 RepID=UPI001F452D6A|nr:energy transducer TonB [Dyadobacter sp. CY343]MCE7059873.1 energy transducer TonB [Dyadobacter sp. CY343]
MATFDTDNAASFQEFHRYHSGEMSDREQNVFEKKLLADPAFAEAYEGFVLMQENGLNATNISQELSGQLQKRIDKTPAKRIAFQVYAAAATIMIVLGVTWLAFFGSGNEPVNHEVSIQVPEAKVGPENGIVAEPKSQPESAPVSPEPNIKSLPRTAYSSIDQNSVPAIVPADPDPAGEILAEDAAEERIATGEPVPSAFPAAPQPLQDAREQLMKTRIASNSSVRYSSSRSEDGSSLLPRKKVSAFSPQPALPDSVVNFGIAKPAGGWLAYQAYLHQNMLTSKDSTTVRVEFIVKTDGALSDFKVSGPAELRDQAIQIIRQGPSWIPAAGDGALADSPVRVSIGVRLKE